MDHPSIFRHQFDAAYKSPENDGGGVMVPTEVCRYKSFSSPFVTKYDTALIRRVSTFSDLHTNQVLTRGISTSERSLSLYEIKRHYIL